MIISDRHQFILVHIPKCAGVSIKQALRCIDDSAGDFSRIADHSELGRIHRAHVPIADLKLYFPDVFDKLHNYCSVAIVRNPVERFVSAIFQRMREFKGADQSAITPRTFRNEAEAVIRHMTAEKNGRLTLEYVHFQRQRDFIFDGDQQVVTNVFRLDQLDLAAELIARQTGISILQDERLNHSAELKAGALQPLVRWVRAPYALLLPVKLRQSIRSTLLGMGLYGHPEPTFFVPPGGNLERAVQDLYAADLELFARSWRDPTSHCIAA